MLASNNHLVSAKTSFCTQEFLFLCLSVKLQTDDNAIRLVKNQEVQMFIFFFPADSILRIVKCDNGFSIYHSVEVCVAWLHAYLIQVYCLNAHKFKVESNFSISEYDCLVALCHIAASVSLQTASPSSSISFSLKLKIGEW